MVSAERIRKPPYSDLIKRLYNGDEEMMARDIVNARVQQDNEVQNALWTAFDALHKRPEPPPNSITDAQYAEHYGISRSRARQRLLDLYRAGKLDRVRIANQYYYSPKSI